MSPEKHTRGHLIFNKFPRQFNEKNRYISNKLDQNNYIIMWRKSEPQPLYHKI
jgi:hypothetical protein